MKKIKEDFLNLINKSENPVIVLSKSANKEVTSAALGIYNYCLKNNKSAEIVSIRKQSNILSFLNGFSQIKNKLTTKKEFVFSFDTKKNQIENVRFKQEGDKLNVYVTPKEGLIEPKDLNFGPERHRFDLIIVLGAAELSDVGDFFEKNTDIFFELPIINIDNSINNDNYGQLNLIDIKACGISEIIADVFIETKIKFNQRIIDSLYAGVLEASESFRNPKTTPKTLNIAAKLIEAGADQKNIVKNLYKTNKFSTVKLWGKIMARMEYIKEINLCWTKVKKEDFKDNNLDVNLIRSIFEKIRRTYTKKDTLLMLWEDNGITQGLIQNSNQETLKEITSGIEWGNAILFEINNNYPLAKKRILDKLKKAFCEV